MRCQPFLLGAPFKLALLGKAVGMVAVPIPGGLDDVFQLLKARPPAELSTDLVGRRHQHRRVSGSARPLVNRDAQPRHFLDGADHLAHTVAFAGAEIVTKADARTEPLQGYEVGFRQILDVNVVAHASAVWSWVVVAKHLNRRPPALGCLDDDRDEVCFWIVILADRSVRVLRRRH